MNVGVGMGVDGRGRECGCGCGYGCRCWCLCRSGRVFECAKHHPTAMCTAFVGRWISVPATYKYTSNPLQVTATPAPRGGSVYGYVYVEMWL